MLNVRIKDFYYNDTQKEKGLCLDIEESTINGMYGAMSRKLLQLLMGDRAVNGDIVLDYISIREEKDEFLRCVRLLNEHNRKRINNKDISVEDYIDLINMIEMKSNSSLKVKKYFSELNLLNRRVLELEEDYKLILEFYASLQKEPKLILLDNFLNCLSEEGIRRVIDILKDYIDNGSVCIIFSGDLELLKKVSQEIFVFTEDEVFCSQYLIQ